MQGKFDPKQYKDTYRENLQKLVAAKAKGKDVTATPEPKVDKVVDILEALRKSLSGNKKADLERGIAQKSPKRKKSSRKKAA